MLLAEAPRINTIVPLSEHGVVANPGAVSILDGLDGYEW